MSRHPSRDMASVEVAVRPYDLGSGRPSDGGGPLQGRLHLMNRVTVDLCDPGLPYLVTMTVRARNGWLSCESIMLSELPDGPRVTGGRLRAVTLDGYVRRVRDVLDALPDGPIIGAGITRSVRPPDTRQVVAKVIVEKITPTIAAELYREALTANSRRPTAEVAERLRISRGHASRMLGQARREGLLGPATKGIAGEALPSIEEPT